MLNRFLYLFLIFKIKTNEKIILKGWIECAGIADRCDYDLRKHSEHASVDFSINKSSDSTQSEPRVPHVIEPSFGIGRLMHVILEHNFKKRSNDQQRFVINL